MASIVALPGIPNEIRFPEIIATAGLDDTYEKVPGADEVGAVTDWGASPCAALMSANPFSVGMIRTVPLTDMRKLFESEAHVAPPSDDDNERNVGAGDTSVVGVVELKFHNRELPTLPLRTMKYCELGASEIGEAGVYESIALPGATTLKLDASVAMRVEGVPPSPANSSSV